MTPEPTSRLTADEVDRILAAADQRAAEGPKHADELTEEAQRLLRAFFAPARRDSAAA